MIKALPYQKEGVLAIERFNGRALLCDEMGLGKTLQALYWLRRNPETLPALVVCPASVKYNWQREAANCIGMRAEVLEGQTPPKEGIVRPGNLLIINYDILPYWLPFLVKLGLQGIVLDECQYVCSRDAQRTQAVQELCKGIDHLLALSGTPLSNRPAELWVVLNLLWPNKYPSFFEYGWAYCKPTKRFGKWEYKGASNLDKLHKELKKHGMIRRLQRDVLKDLPKNTTRVITVPLYDPDGEYKRAERDFIGWLTKIDPNKAKRAIRSEQITKVGYMLRLTAKLKLKACVGWVNRFLEETEEKIVVFAKHKKVIDVCRRRINGKHVIIDGSVTGKKRDLAVQQFQHDKVTRVCIGNLDAAGIGINLTAATTTAHIELDWRPTIHKQAGKRIHRIGQKQKSFNYFLVAANTIEEKICKALQKKQGNLNEILDGFQSLGEEQDLNVLDMLLTSMARRK